MSGKLQLSVADPCHESWAKMTLTEQGRFCDSCQKTVTDFSLMSDKEILNHLSHRDTNICGRFTTDQLNRPLRTERTRKFSRAYLWNFFIATFLTTASAEAQSQKANPKETIRLRKDIREKVPEVQGNFIGEIVFSGPTTINGTIFDSKSNLPIGFASIRNVNELARGVAADSSGVFSIPVSSQKEIVLTISAIGYQSQEFTIAPGSNKLSFYLEPLQELLEPVVITADPALSCRSAMLGALSIRSYVIRSEKLKRYVDDLTPELVKKREVKLFPNPVSPGSTLTLALSLKNAGDYTTEILDASGRIVYRGQISMQSKIQNISIPTSVAWSKGIYWVRVIGKDSKQKYHSKLVVQ